VALLVYLPAAYLIAGVAAGRALGTTVVPRLAERADLGPVVVLAESTLCCAAEVRRRCSGGAVQDDGDRHTRQETPTAPDDPPK
jgi:hypothetical protein